MYCIYSWAIEFGPLSLERPSPVTVERRVATTRPAETDQTLKRTTAVSQ